MYRFYAVTARECRGKGKSLYLNVKTTVVFTLSWAGVTPAPSNKSRMRDFVPVRTFLVCFLTVARHPGSSSLPRRVSCWRLSRQQRERSPKQLPTGTKSRIFLNSKVQGLPLPKEV